MQQFQPLETLFIHYWHHGRLIKIPIDIMLGFPKLCHHWMIMLMYAKHRLTISDVATDESLNKLIQNLSKLMFELISSHPIIISRCQTITAVKPYSFKSVPRENCGFDFKQFEREIYFSDKIRENIDSKILKLK